MSRYVRVETSARTLDELAAALAALELIVERGQAGARLMLQGSLECAGEPVDLRLPPGQLDAVEDFGFLRGPTGRIELVCGEYDRSLLEERLLPRLAAALTRARARAHAKRAGLAVEEVLEADGLRIKLRTR
ncbi:MAG: hypothetical protein KC636_37975 [Myxococcales bacterium]|nr:hypothetical protein [Myxococcales bacterium]